MIFTTYKPEEVSNYFCEVNIDPTIHPAVNMNHGQKGVIFRQFDTFSNSIVTVLENGASISLEVEGHCFGFLVSRHPFAGDVMLSVNDQEVIKFSLHQDINKNEPVFIGFEREDLKNKKIQIFSYEGQVCIHKLFMCKNDLASFSPDLKKNKSLDVPIIENCIFLNSQISNNIGDIYSCPALYFGGGDPIRRNITDWDPVFNPFKDLRREFEDLVENNNVIIGGGGLLNHQFFAKSFEVIQSIAKKKIIFWGLGHNSPMSDFGKLSFLNYENWNLRIGAIGVRDFASRYPWVPCASCMSNEFDKQYSKKRHVGFYMHKNRIEYGDLDRITEDKSTILTNDKEFEKVIKFLAESEVVVTDSFHGAYWSVLLGVKVVALPTSSKFFSMRHPIPLINNIFDWENYAVSSPVYLNALQEARCANINFAHQVKLNLNDLNNYQI